MNSSAFRRRLLVCVAAVQALLLPFSSIQPVHAADTTSSTPHVVIGEVAWAGSSASIADEWLELWNLDTTDASIGGWTLTGATDDPLVFSATATISGLGVYVISNYASSDGKSVLAAPSQIVTTGVSLSNSALQITLTDANGQVVDIAGDGKTPPAGSSGDIKSSMIRTIVNNVAGGWVSATSAMNLKPGITDLATPGWCDGCFGQSGQVSNPNPELPTNTSPTSTNGGTDGTAAGGSIDPGSDSSTLDVTPDPTVPTAPADTSTDPIVPIQLGTMSASPPAPDTPPVPNYHELRLNEIAPAPSTGKEWIELVSLDAQKSIPLTGCELHDAQSRILKLTSGSIAPDQHLVLRLTRTVLGNAGDAVSLYAPDGGLIDTYRYGATKKGQAWTRYPDTTGPWQLSASSTPGSSNILVAPVAKTSVASAINAAASSSVLVDSDTLGSESVGTSIDDQTDTSVTYADDDADVTDETADPIDGPPTMSDIVTSSAPLQTSKRSVTKKTAAAMSIRPLTFDMLSTLDAADQMHVQIRGIVGTPPKLIKNRSFVLQASDGRGLLVTATTDRSLPMMGQSITLTGYLTTSLDGAALKLHADDAWSAHASSTLPLPRDANLFAPAGEDIWSLVQVTGTVQSVAGRKVRLDVDGMEADIVISGRLQYRPQRLTKGDTLHVVGILAPFDDVPIIYPRDATEIAIVHHASLARSAATATPSTPTGASPIGTWTPVGAAAGAIGVAEGAKKLHRRRKQRSLEQKVKIKKIPT